jgi:hypothetical protein
MIFLAINYGCYEGWELKEYASAEEAIAAVKSGETHGIEWKILKELTISVDEGCDK